MSSFRDRFATLPASEKRVTLRALPQFLAKANKVEGLYKILTDFGFIELKVEKEGVQPLIDDYDLVVMFSITLPDQRNENLLSLKKSLRLSAEIVNEDNKRLSEQLLSRLITSDNPDIQSFLTDVKRQKALQGKPWLRHQTPTLPQADSPLVRTLTGHKDMIQALAVTLDESRLISASWDTDIKVWDVKAGVELRTLKGHTGIVHSLQITSDGRRVVSASSDGTIKVWDIESGSQHQEMVVGAINSMALTSDNTKVVSASSDQTVKVWDLESGTLINTLIGHRRSVHVVAITPDDKYVISAEGEAEGISAISPKGSMLNTGFSHTVPTGTSASLEGGFLTFSLIHDFQYESLNKPTVVPNLIKIWSLETGAELFSLENGHASYTSVLAVSPDGRTLIAGSGALLKVWKLEDTDNIKVTLLRYLKGHQRSIYGLSFTHDGTQIVSSSHDSTLRIWDLDRGTEIKTFPQHDSYVNALSISANANLLFTGSADGLVKIWDFSKVSEYCPSVGHEAKVTAIKLADDGERGFSVSWDSKVKVWDIKTGKAISDIGSIGRPLNKHELGFFPLSTVEHRFHDQIRKQYTSINELCYFGRVVNLGSINPPINAIATTPNNRAVIVSVLGGLLACELLSGKNGISTIVNSHYEIGLPEELVEDCCVTRDGLSVILGLSLPRLAFKDLVPKFRAESAPKDQSSVDACFLTVLDFAQGAIRRFKGHKATVRAVAATLDGKTIVSGSDDTTARVWDLASAKELKTLSGHSKGISSVVVTSDSKCAVTASQDGAIKVWDLVTGEGLSTLEGHSAGINAIALAPDNRTLISVSSDKMLKVWNIESGEVIASFKEDGCLLSCAIASDGVSILVGEQSGKVHSLKLEGVTPLISSHQQARIYRKQGNYSQAESSYMEVLEDKIRLLGKEHPDITYLVSEISKFFLDLNNLSRAEELLQSVSNGKYSILDPLNFEMAVIINLLESVFSRSGQYQKARTCMITSTMMLMSFACKKEPTLRLRHPYERVADAFLNLHPPNLSYPNS